MIHKLVLLAASKRESILECEHVVVRTHQQYIDPGSLYA